MRHLKNTMLRYKKATLDMILNIVANGIPIIVLQLIILPLVSNKMGEDEYGWLVTILALLNTIPASFGNVLNNIRLIYNPKDASSSSDFHLIMYLLEIISASIVILATIFYSQENQPIVIIMLVLISFLWLAREYYLVAFRLVINYKAILLANVFLVLGYLTGYAVFIFSNQWYWIYIIGNFTSLIYILSNTRLHKEKVRRTPNFTFLLVQTSMLLVSGVLLKCLTYADKFLIYPILGGATVSVYYVSTLSGKIVSLLVGPIAGVMLTYLAKMKKNDRVFKEILLLGIVTCIGGYFFGILVSRPILGIIYPSYVDRAMEYVYITTGTAVLSALYSLLNPFIIRFFSMKWQIVVNASTVLFYVVFSLVLLKMGGLMGFCIGALLTNLLRVIFLIIIYFKSNTINSIKTTVDD